jgi:hypothetical protein
MMTRLNAGVVALALFAAFTARADLVETSSITLGAMAERADLVVVADAATAPATKDGRIAWSFRVSESLREPKAAGDVRVLLAARRTGETPAVVVQAGGSHLLFLRSIGGGDYEPIAEPWGLRNAAESEVRPLVEYTRRYGATLARDGSVAKPDDLAALLVESLASRASGVPMCAGLDLVRHEEIVAALTPAQRQAVDAALAVPRKGDLDLASIIDAAGAAGTAASDASLLARLLDPSTRNPRLNITAALRRHARPELVTALASNLAVATATPQQRADVVNALGRLDRREAAPHLVKALGDAEAIVRVEAAHSLGLLARAVRAPADGADADAPREKLADALDPLVAAVATAKSESEKRSLCWSVAQIDTAESWAALKKLRDEAKDARVREIAGQYVLHPRVELILE